MYHLKEFNSNMGKAEYEMLQEIPAKENGSTNLCKGIPFESFPDFLEAQLARQFQKISYYDTPTKMYIFYVDKLPVGYIGIRTKINKDWKNWCGNIFYAVRPSQRQKHYGTKMLKYALQECKKLNINPIYIKAAAGNIGSQKMIENNKAQLLKIDEDGGRFYKVEQ